MTRPQRCKPYQQAKELQELVMRDARADSTKVSVRASLARAFVELEELKLRIMFVPHPKSVDPAKWQAMKQAAKVKAASTLPDEFKHAA